MDELTIICEDINVIGTEDLRVKVVMSGVDESFIQCTDKLRGEIVSLKACMEQSAKERDWLLTSYAQIYKDTYSGIVESIDEIKEHICLLMNKELKK